jgi:hypothetical protein
MMPAGKYYIGDLCYVMADEEWREICNIIIKEPHILDGEFELPDGRRFAIYSTAYGDGTYHDQHGHAYSVDAGSIGCIRLDDIKYVDNFDQFLDLGAIQEFAEPFVTGSQGGQLQFGHVVIETDAVDWYEDEL